MKLEYTEKFIYLEISHQYWKCFECTKFIYIHINIVCYTKSNFSHISSKKYSGFDKKELYGSIVLINNAEKME